MDQRVKVTGATLINDPTIDRIQYFIHSINVIWGGTDGGFYRYLLKCIFSYYN
jgi:hypothetical protein